jgi:hypothetical protein
MSVIYKEPKEEPIYITSLQTSIDKRKEEIETNIVNEWMNLITPEYIKEQIIESSVYGKTYAIIIDNSDLHNYLSVNHLLYDTITPFTISVYDKINQCIQNENINIYIGGLDVRHIIISWGYGTIITRHCSKHLLKYALLLGLFAFIIFGIWFIIYK